MFHTLKSAADLSVWALYAQNGPQEQRQVEVGEALVETLEPHLCSGGNGVQRRRSVAKAKR